MTVINVSHMETRDRFLTTLAISALTIELGTSMKISNRASALDYARNCGAISRVKRTTKMPALKACIAKMQQMDPNYEIPPTTQRVLPHQALKPKSHSQSGKLELRHIDCSCGWQGRLTTLEKAKAEHAIHADGGKMQWETEK